MRTGKFVEASGSVYEDPVITADWRDGLYDYVRSLMGLISGGSRLRLR